MALTAAEIEERLDGGVWLRPGQVAKLFGVSRWAVDYWIRNGVTIDGKRMPIGWRTTPGGWRELDPADVRIILASYRRRRTAADADG